jgi:hypothetical protein
VDVGVGLPELRAILEVYAGDPLDALGPDRAVQWGGRWLVSDYLNLDVTFGAQPDLQVAPGEAPRTELWGQVGIRLLFDVFTENGEPGDFMGAKGLLVRRGYGKRG